ncbi:hypothetical protein RchiOBHm_Chr3g0495611 [Rosa chinensis]|uniref:Uncharacterized protein n=1 Tax=Rosa chinensis TaxID=74649 RepID=A0A2P6RH91_ROSCH|nr:hypothetical protein RchiOBHm_Chr3g0495611 [Rosa chinensis]
MGFYLWKGEKKREKESKSGETRSSPLPLHFDARANSGDCFAVRQPPDTTLVGKTSSLPLLPPLPSQVRISCWVAVV